MAIKIGAENHPLFDQVQAALKIVAAEAAGREGAVNEQALASSEAWAAWQSKGLQESKRLAECLDFIRAAQQRTDANIGEADAELAKVETALQEWVLDVERCLSKASA